VSDRQGKAGSPARKGKRQIHDSNRGIFIFLCVLPAFLFLAVFLYYPIEETFRISLTQSTGLGDEVYVGIDNYAKLFTNEEFLAGLWHVFGWAFWSIVIQLPLTFLIAFSLTFYVNRFTRPLRSIYYLSNVLPSAIVSMLGLFVFTPKTGILSSLGKTIGWKALASLDVLGNPDTAFWGIFAVATWAYIGFPIIYLMARIEQIPKEVREAAELDGATGWRYALSIVLPDLSYPMRIIAVLETVGSLKLFDLPNMMTVGGPGYATTTLGVILYRQGFVNWNYGKAAAIGVVIFLLCLAFTIIQFSYGNKQEEAK
jgi:ABC-type sugar transport system permease subunit